MASTRPLAFITGANQGIGLQVAQTLAQKYDYHVIIGSRKKEAGDKVASELNSKGHKASSVQLDLDSQASIEAAIATIEKDFGYLDILINNAGILIDHLPIASKYELYTKTFSTNVIGPGALTEGLVPLIQNFKVGPPRVIFVSSTMGSIAISKDKTTPWYNFEAKVYDASKAAVNMLAVNFDRVLGGIGAKVNAVCPGKVSTNLTGYDGSDLETGAAKIVELAVAGEDGVSATFARSDGEVPW